MCLPETSMNAHPGTQMARLQPQEAAQSYENDALRVVGPQQSKRALLAGNLSQPFDYRLSRWFVPPLTRLQEAEVERRRWERQRLGAGELPWHIVSYESMT